MSFNQWGTFNQWSAPPATVSASVTEQSTDASESSNASIVAPGVIAISATEVSASFSDESQVQITGRFSADVTEVSEDFTEACFIQLPVIRLSPKKVIRVTGRQKTLIRVR